MENKMKSICHLYRCLGGLLLLGIVNGCQLFEDFKPQQDDQTLQLLTANDGIWKVDSFVYTIFPSPDSVMINFGTFRFMSPEEVNYPGFGTGYLIHEYTVDGITYSDTSAWIPSNIGSVNSAVNDLSIYFKSPTGQPGYFSDGLSLQCHFRIKKKKLVSFYGEGGGPASQGSAITKVRTRYRLSQI